MKKFMAEFIKIYEDKPNEGMRFIQNSGVRDYYIKQDFTLLPNPKHTIKFGLNYIYHYLLLVQHNPFLSLFVENDKLYF